MLAANGGGAFVNVLSVASWVGVPTLATYAASKAAAWGFTNAARVELKRQGTQVVGVHVGFVDTDLTAALDIDKIPPAAVAPAAFDALEAGAPEAVVDEFSRTVKAGLHDDQRLIYPSIEAGVRGGGRADARLRPPAAGPRVVAAITLVSTACSCSRSSSGHPEAFHDGRRDLLRLARAARPPATVKVTARLRSSPGARRRST